RSPAHDLDVRRHLPVGGSVKMKMPAAVALVVFVGIAGEAAAPGPHFTPPQLAPMSPPPRVCFGNVPSQPGGEQCSGKVYPSGLAPATDAYLILAIDEIRRVSGLLQQLIQSESSVVTSMNNLSTTTTNTQTLWTNQATAFA